MTQDPIHNPDVTAPKAPKPIIPGEEGAPEGPGTQGAPQFSLGQGKGGGAAIQEGPSPMELSAQTGGRGPIHPVEPPTVERLQAQAQNISAQITSLHQVLGQAQAQYPNAQFNAVTSNLINNNVGRVTSSFSFISDKLHTQPFQPPKPSAAHSNVVYFLNYLAGSQDQLATITKSLADAPPGSITPGTLMAVQVKMNSIQQQVEFFTVILGKATDSIKNIMNIQS